VRPGHHSTATEQGPHLLGLRRRAILAFGAGATLVSMTLAFATYAVAHHYLLSRRQTSSVIRTMANARFVQQELASPNSIIPDVLSSLATAQGTQSLLYRHGRWFSPSVSIGHSYVPSSLIEAVAAGNPAEQRTVIDGAPAIAVGVPIPSIGADFFQVRGLGDLQQTFGTLGAVLFGTAIATTVGGCLLGWWAGRRLMRPITTVATVATAIAGGAIDRRLPVDLDRDPDLGSLSIAFNDMVAKLELRIERDARFASDVSHELRSPLTAVNTSVDLLEHFRSSLPPRGERALDLLRLEVSRFSTMVQDLLEIARMDARAATLDLEGISIDEFVGRIVARRGTHVPVRISATAAGSVVQVDKKRLQRVLENILDNADAYAGGAVLVTVDRDSSGTCVGVEDDGPGISPHERERIFERFFRGAAAGRRGTTSGTGLGLSLAAEHVRAHGGSITAENRLEGGARFTITLPVIGE